MLASNDRFFECPTCLQKPVVKCTEIPISGEWI